VTGTAVKMKSIVHARKLLKEKLHNSGIYDYSISFLVYRQTKKGCENID
jgi:hypothetical protein